MSVATKTTPKSHRTSVRNEVRGSESPRSGAGPESSVVRCMLTYLPHDDFAHFGLSQADMLAQRQTPSATLLIANCVATARASMQFGSQLVHQVPGRAGWELRLVVQGGLRILDRIEALNYATLSQRPTLRWFDFPVILWRALWM